MSNSASNERQSVHVKGCLRRRIRVDQPSTERRELEGPAIGRDPRHLLAASPPDERDKSAADAEGPNGVDAQLFLEKIQITYQAEIHMCAHEQVSNGRPE